MRIYKFWVAKEIKKNSTLSNCSIFTFFFFFDSWLLCLHIYIYFSLSLEPKSPFYDDMFRFARAFTTEYENSRIFMIITFQS